MGHSYVSSYFHLVWSTKDRSRMIEPAIQRELYKYIAGICRNHDMKALEIGGMKDHIHILASLPGKLDPAKAVNLIKANSSRWMHEEVKKFAWQEGYGAFSVSVSNLDSVSIYICTQEEHHKKRSFETEFIALLKKHNLPYDPKYVFG